MNRADLIKHVQAELGGTRTAAIAAVSAVLGGVESALRKGDPVRLTGFGGFAVQKVSARAARNPATGETLEAPAYQTVRFHVSRVFRDSLNPKKPAKSAKPAKGKSAKPAKPAKKSGKKQAKA